MIKPTYKALVLVLLLSVSPLLSMTIIMKALSSVTGVEDYDDEDEDEKDDAVKHES